MCVFEDVLSSPHITFHCTAWTVGPMARTAQLIFEKLDFGFSVGGGASSFSDSSLQWSTPFQALVHLQHMLPSSLQEMEPIFSPSWLAG